MLQMRCASCNRLADTADLFARRLKDRKDGALERFCVRATDRIQGEGWQFVEGRSFLCPDCSGKSG
jgi:hypothetical protein